MFDRFRRWTCEVVCGGFWPDDDGEFTVDDEIVPPGHLEGCFLFLRHSDYRGELTVEECKLVRDFLLWVYATDDDTLFNPRGVLMKEVAWQFAKGCDEAAKAGEALVFK